MVVWWWRLGLVPLLLGDWCLAGFLLLFLVFGCFWLVAWVGRWFLWFGWLGFVLAVWVVGRLWALWWVGGFVVGWSVDLWK